MDATVEPMISLSAASKAERPALDNLMQLYIYDWSDLRPLDVGDDGRFPDYPLDAYWEDAGGHPLLLRVDGRLAGFALVSERSRLTGAPGVFDMAEFFVMRRFRRKGVGLAAASAAFDRFKGPWEIRQHDENTAATAFWRSAIDRYTGGSYREVRWDDRAWTGPVQMFSS
jgi:predicted acetyltransferase